jgi:microcystin-dependent protein
MLMDGSAISRSLYPDLFSLIGTTFGAGDGSTTFNLPDARGRFILPTGQGASLANRILAAVGGEETHVLVTGELAAHAHSIAAGQFNHGHSISDPNHQHVISNMGGLGTAAGGQSTWCATGVNNYTAAAGTGIGIVANTLPAGSTANNGSGTAHNNMPPFLVLTFIIKVSAGGSTDQAAIADTTQAGLVNKISGYVTDYLTGANTCIPLPSATQVAAGFTMPAVGYTVNITVTDTSWMSVGMILNLLVGGNLQQVQINSITSKQLGVTNYSGPVTGAVGVGALVTYAAFAVAGVNQPGIVNALSGKVTDYLGGDNACHAMPPAVGPTAEYYDKDDFLAHGAISATSFVSKLFVINNSGGTSAVSQAITNNYPGHPGVIQLAPGTTAAAWSRMFMNAGPFFLDGNITITIQGLMTLATGGFAGTNQYFFGFCTNAGPAIATTQSYAGVYCNAAVGPNWTMYTRNLAVAAVNADSGVPVTTAVTWHKFKIVATLGSVSFYIDDNLVGTTTDNSIPTGTAILYVSFFTNNGSGTSNLSLLVDCFDVWLQPVEPSGQPQTRFMR